LLIVYSHSHWVGAGIFLKNKQFEYFGSLKVMGRGSACVVYLTRRRGCLTRGRFMPFILWYSPHALHR